MSSSPAGLQELATQARAWPFEEARKMVERYSKKPPEKGYVLFETGYGPSGLPHIGTFGEVVRTSMVRHAFTTLSDIPTGYSAFGRHGRAAQGARQYPEQGTGPRTARQAADPDPRSVRNA